MQKVNKNEIFQQITVNTNEIYQLDVLKVAPLTRSMKGAVTGSFHRGPFNSLLSGKGEQKSNISANYFKY